MHCRIDRGKEISFERPELPRFSVNTSTPRESGRVIAVPADGDFQHAVHDAQPGDTIVLQAAAKSMERRRNSFVICFLSPAAQRIAGERIMVRGKKITKLRGGKSCLGSCIIAPSGRNTMNGPVKARAVTRRAFGLSASVASCAWLGATGSETGQAKNDEFVSLFDGDSLNGWHTNSQRNGR
jgi:hypothetical protein